MDKLELNKDLLLKDFPVSAMRTLPGGARLTTIQAGYITERINDVWGHGNWTFEVLESERIGDEVLIKLEFKPSIGLNISQYGGAIKRNGSTWGDTYKSATTDALNKCASYYGIGNSVFKGEVSAQKLSSMKSGDYKSSYASPQPKKEPIKEKLTDKASPAQVRYVETLLGNKKRVLPDFDILAELKKYDVKSVQELGKREASNIIKEFQVSGGGND